MVRNKILTQGNKNWALYVLIVFMILGVSWGWLVEVKAGEVYGKILVLTTSVLTLTWFWLDEDDRKTMKDYFSTPITSSSTASIGALVFGWIVVAIFNLIGLLSKAFLSISFTSTQFYGSLYFSGNGLTQGLSQSFQASVVESSKLAEFFYSCIVAPIQEELTWGLILYLVFYGIGLSVVKAYYVSRKKQPKSTFYQKVASIIALFGVFLTFMYVHKLNNSYVGYMFLIAGIFRLLVNISIYFYGMILSFAIGIHMANNTSAFIQQYGFSTLLTALFSSPFGWLMIAGFLGILGSVLFKPDIFIKAVRKEIAERS